MPQAHHKTKSGFTLIELSILLVIIGLIVGGVLTGQDLINTAAQRAQIAQIEKYQTAVNLFQIKYNGYLPGDIPSPYATKYGFQSRGQYAGEGDGNGVIEGNCSNTAGNNNGFHEGCGELAVFWQDLSIAGLIDTTVGSGSIGSNYPQMTSNPWPDRTLSTTPSISNWLPAAKIGQNSFVYLYSFFSINYFSVSTVTDIGWSISSTVNPGITVQQAYNIDHKIDDGLPQSGSVTACYVNFQVGNYEPVYAAGNLLKGANGGYVGDRCIPTTTATSPATQATDCYNNRGVAGVMTYYVAGNANLLNCALSFQFQ